MGEGKRHFGFPNEETVVMYTREEFVSGCSFNFWMGAGAGAAGTVLFLLAVAWKLNIL